MLLWLTTLLLMPSAGAEAEPQRPVVELTYAVDSQLRKGPQAEDRSGELVQRVWFDDTHIRVDRQSESLVLDLELGRFLSIVHEYKEVYAFSTPVDRDQLLGPLAREAYADLSKMWSLREVPCPEPTAAQDSEASEATVFCYRSANGVARDRFRIEPSSELAASHYWLLLADEAQIRPGREAAYARFVGQTAPPAVFEHVSEIGQRWSRVVLSLESVRQTSVPADFFAAPADYQQMPIDKNGDFITRPRPLDLSKVAPDKLHNLPKMP